MKTDLNRILSKYYWHQRWEVEPGVFTPGCNDVQSLLANVSFPDSLQGKRVLDIGAWNGCFSFECVRRGAASVVSIGPERPDETGYNDLRDYLGYDTEYRFGSIYDLDPCVLGTFDVVLCFGVFYHLRYPTLGIDNIRRVCRGDLFLESAALDHYLVTNGDSEGGWVDFDTLHPLLNKVALMQFFEKDNLNADYSNWFAPNLTCMVQILSSAGFQVRTARTVGVRLLVSAGVQKGIPDFLSPSTGEGAYYDLFLKKMFGPLETWRVD